MAALKQHLIHHRTHPAHVAFHQMPIYVEGRGYITVAQPGLNILGYNGPAMVPTEALAAETSTLAEPKVTGLTVSVDGGEPVDLLNGQPTVSMSAGSKPVFTVSFDSTEVLNKVYVTSTKDNETKYLEATLQNGKYVTDGYFDLSDTNYIPGTISVTYSKKVVKVTESDNIGGTNLGTLKTQLNNQGIAVENTSTGEDGEVTARVVFKDVLAEEGNVYFDATISEFAGDDAEALTSWLGAFGSLAESAAREIEGDDNKKYELYLKKIDDSGLSGDYVGDLLVILRDISGNKYTKTVIHPIDKKQSLDEIADELSAVNTAASTLADYYTITKESNELRDEIEKSSMSSTEKAL